MNRPRSLGLLAALVATLLPVSGEAQAPPGTDIFLAPLSLSHGKIALGTAINITSRPGYDNQPSFTPDGKSILYTSVREDAQSDIYRYDLVTHSAHRLTVTTESEYSATVTPDRKGFSVIRVERDSTQRLWRFNLDGSSPSLVLDRVKPVGYQAWADDHSVLLFVLGAPPTLQLADTRSGNAEVLAKNIGRSIHKIPGRNAMSYVLQMPDSTAWIMELDRVTKASKKVVETLKGSQDYAWLSDGSLIMGKGNAIHRWDGKGWEIVTTFDAVELQKITRIAVSPRGDWVAFVSEEPK